MSKLIKNLKKSINGEKFEPSKLKSYLQMSQIRMTQLKNKKQNMLALQRRQVAELLKEDKDESARIKAENIVRDDFIIEAIETLQVLCEALQSRTQIILESHECPIDLKEAVTTIIWAAPRIEVPELQQVRHQFMLKWGPRFVEQAGVNHDLTVNERIMVRLCVKSPEPYLVISYMKKIAEQHGIEFEDMTPAPAPIDINYNGGNNNFNNGNNYGGNDFGGYQPPVYTQPQYSPAPYQDVSVPMPNGRANQLHNPNLYPQTNDLSTYESQQSGHGSRQSYQPSYAPGSNTYQQQQRQSTVIPNVPSTSGYTVDFQPKEQHPLAHTIPTYSSDYESSNLNSGDNAELSFEELQARFNMLKT